LLDDALEHTVLRVLILQTLVNNSVVKDPLTCSKLGLGDEILHPHHSTSNIHLGGLAGPYQLDQHGCTSFGFLAGAHHCGGRARSSILRKLWRFSALGFFLQDLAHQFEGFLEESSHTYHLFVGWDDFRRKRTIW
jgi:hypothetical protein